MRIGSLFSGFSGLDMAVRDVLGGELAWVADNDPAATAVLAARHPDVSNLGDVTAVDWSEVAPVDVLTAGWPCQPVSSAGRRAALDDERWLFDAVLAAARGLEPCPGLLVCENVPGLLTAGHGHAMGRVVEGLAALGYVGRYRLLRASDVGAPHKRERVFIVAADTSSQGREGSGPAKPNRRCVAAVDAAAYTESIRGRPRRSSDGEPFGADGPCRGSESASHPTGNGRDARQPRPARIVGGSDASLGSGTTADPAGVRDSGRSTPDERGTSRVEQHRAVWGDYAGAIARWEHILGRPAPAATEPGRTGQRLSPRFVEWLMGLPEGHVTDVSGLSRNAQLRLLGNGVVPAQAAVALTSLLEMEGVTAA